MLHKTLLGMTAVVLVPAAMAGGYWLPHPTSPPPSEVQFDLPPASIVEWVDEKGPKRAMPGRPLADHVLQDHPTLDRLVVDQVDVF